MKSGEMVKVIQAIFCVYDIVFHRDVRVEISFPGKTTLYAIDESLKKDHVSELEWTCAFVSSVLRSFHSHSGPAVRIFPPLHSKSLYSEFFIAAKLVISKGILNIKLRKKDFNWGQLMIRCLQRRIIWQVKLLIIL